MSGNEVRCRSLMKRQMPIGMVFALAAIVLASRAGSSEPYSCRRARATLSMTPVRQSPAQMRVGSGPHRGPPARFNLPRNDIAHVATRRIDLLKGQEDAAASDVAPSWPFASPVLRGSYAGIPKTDSIPPDPHLAVGQSHVILVVNTSWAIYSKSDGSRLTSYMSLEDWFSDVLDYESVFDPKVIYDSVAKRFIIVLMAENDSAESSAWLISVSETSDPTGYWWNYRLEAELFADYPGVGIDKLALYLTGNMFGWGDDGQFEYVQTLVLPKAKLYAGASSIRYWNLWDFDDGNETIFTLQPALNYANTPYNYLINSAWENSRITLWKISNPTSSNIKTESWNIDVTPYDEPPDAVQKGGPKPIDTGDFRILNAVYRSGKLYGAHTIGSDWGSGLVTACRWYEISASAHTLTQEGTYGADGVFYARPAIMPDAKGNVFMVFNRSSANEYCGIRFCGRTSSDPGGQMSSSVKLIDGRSYYYLTYGGTRNRWGDYNGIALDPSQTNSVWIFSEYAAGKTRWATQFGHILFP